MFGRQFLSAVVAEQSVSRFLEHGHIDHLFTPAEEELHAFVRQFAREYGKVPGAETIKAHLGEELPAVKETSEYYLDLMRLRHTETSCRTAMKKASDLLLADNKDPEACARTLTDAMMQLATQRLGKKIADFRQAYELIVPEYVQQYKAEAGNKLMLGWPTFDGMTGGLTRGDLTSLIGLTGEGKTTLMLYAAHHGWRKAILKYIETKDESVLDGASRLFVSNEMPILQIAQRLTGMHAHLAPDKIKKASLSSPKLKQLKENLIEVKGYPVPFYIVDGNVTATVEDVFVLCRQLKPGGVFLDGAYMFKHPTERDRYRRVAENTDLIKSQICPLAPTVASWQFARSALKKLGKGKKVKEQVTLEDVGYAHAISEISSVVLGMFEDATVETLLRRLVQIMKGRAGEVGQFYTNWDWNDADFSEWVEEKVSDLSYM